MTANVMLVTISQPTTLWYQVFLALSFAKKNFKKNLWDQGISQQDTAQLLSLEKCPYLFLLLKSKVTVQLFPLITIWIVQFVIIENSIVIIIITIIIIFNSYYIRFPQYLSDHVDWKYPLWCHFFVSNVFYSPSPFPGKRWIRSIVIS